MLLANSASLQIFMVLDINHWSRNCLSYFHKYNFNQLRIFWEGWRWAIESVNKTVSNHFFPYREVQKALNNVKSLYARWQELLNNPLTVGKDDHNWTTNELRNNLRSIEWDLEDLDETISIVEANPRKFSLDMAEVNQRKQFIKQTRETVNNIKEHMNSPAAKAKVENSTREVGQQAVLVSWFLDRWQSNG